MLPRLIQGNGGNYTGGGTGDVAWTDTVPTGKRRLMIVCGAAREEGGEQNPEEPNVAYVNGASVYGHRFDPGGDGNDSEFGSGAYYWLDSELPTPGAATVGVNFKDSPKYAEKHRGISASFTNIRQQAPEAYGRSVGNGGVPRSVNITTLSPNALILAMFAWRVGFAETWGGGMTPIVTNRGDNALGISLAYAIKATPGPFTVSCTTTNPENNALIVAVFAPSKDSGGGFLPQFQ